MDDPGAKGLLQRGGMREQEFRPFYEWIPDRFPIPFIVKMMVAGAVGFLFLIPRYVVVGNQIIPDWSWLLCVIIIAALICLYYATHTFRAMFQQLNLRLPEGEAQFPERNEHLSNRSFFVGGLIFALLNCLVAWVLGVPENGFWAIATMYIGFFLAGFVCGMAVAGIRGVVITLTRYLDRGPKVDYTDPDGCGGLLFLGQALIKFSTVTMVVGLLISIYILELGWSQSTDSSDLVRAAMWMWIAFPFLLSLTILLAPASRANRVLMNHKIQQEVELALALNKARDDLQEAREADRQDVSKALKRREELRREAEYFGKLRGQLHQMRAWPLNAETNIKFIILFVTNAVVAFESIRGLIARH